MLPKNNFNSLFGDIEQHWYKLIDNFFSPPSVSEMKNKIKNSGFPRLNSGKVGDTYRVVVSVAGVNPDDLNVEEFSEDGIRYIRVSGQISEQYKDEESSWRIRELRYGQFSRVVAIPEECQGEPEANMKDGILTLVWNLPKIESNDKEVKKISFNKV